LTCGKNISYEVDGTEALASYEAHLIFRDAFLSGEVETRALLTLTLILTLTLTLFPTLTLTLTITLTLTFTLIGG